MAGRRRTAAVALVVASISLAGQGLVSASATGTPSSPTASASAVGVAAEPTTSLAPVPATADPSDPGVQLNDVACAKAGTCFAVGSFNRPGYDRRALVVTLQDGQWTSTELPLPRDAARLPGAGLTAVSCAGANRCAAVGAYAASGPSSPRPLVVTWNGSDWKATSPRLPADAATLTIPPLVAVSCGGRRACVAVGSYPTRAGTVLPLMVTLRSGRGTAVAGRLPRDADSGELWAVDCAAPRACVAVGSYELQGANPGDAVPQRPLAERLSGETWRVSVPPVPKDARRPVRTAILYDVACPARSRCTAVGKYYRDTTPGLQGTGLVDVLSPRGWRAGSVRPPRGFRSNHVELTEVGCASVRVCVAAGSHGGLNAGGVLPIVARLRGPAGSAPDLPLPTDATRPEGLLNDIACGDRSPCTGVGSVKAGGGGHEALIVVVGRSDVRTSVAPLPPDAFGAVLNAVAAQSGATAVAVGTVLVRGRPGQQGLLVTGIPAQ